MERAKGVIEVDEGEGARGMGGRRAGEWARGKYDKCMRSTANAMRVGCPQGGVAALRNSNSNNKKSERTNKQINSQRV